MAPPSRYAEQEVNEHSSIVRTVLAPEDVIAAPESLDTVHDVQVQEVKVVEVVTERKVE